MPDNPEMPADGRRWPWTTPIAKAVGTLNRRTSFQPRIRERARLLYDFRDLTDLTHDGRGEPEDGTDHDDSSAKEGAADQLLEKPLSEKPRVWGSFSVFMALAATFLFLATLVLTGPFGVARMLPATARIEILGALFLFSVIQVGYGFILHRKNFHN